MKTQSTTPLAAVDQPRIVLRLRPRWKRILMWPFNFWKTFRIGSYRPMPLRVKVAFDVANGIVRLNPQNADVQRPADATFNPVE
jgi:hypothetical protein